MHHPGWVEGHLRGASSFRAGLDTELEIKGKGSITLEATKQRFRADGPKWYLTIEPRGASCVVVSSVEGSIDDLRGKTRDALAALLDADDPAGLTTNQWRATADAPEGSFFRTKTELVRRGLFENIGTGRMSRYRVTDQGRAVLAAGLA